MLRKAKAFPMYLDDAKMGKLFGSKPFLGRPIPGFKVETQCGIQWQGLYGSGSYKKVKTQVNLMVSARRLKKGLWEITCPEVAYERVIFWLMEKGQ